MLPSAGLFHSVCHIPGNLLNCGFHRVGPFLVWGDMMATYRLDEAFWFDVIDDNERMFVWFGREPGVVQPSLNWETEYLSLSCSTAKCTRSSDS